MEDVLLVILTIFAFAAFIGLYIYFTAKRRKELLAVAQQLGFMFYPGGRFHFEKQFSSFELFQRGRSRRSYNLIEGRSDGIEVRMFDYQYTTGSGKNRTTHRKSVCLLETASRRGSIFPHVIIRPESLFDRFASMVGFNDIDFESVEFSRKFFVKSRDRRFAYDLIHPRMMEFLLRVGSIHIEVASRAVLIHHDRRLAPDRWPGLLNIGMRFLEQVPQRLVSPD